MQILRNRKGFTLIELMIVVAIIGILAAIAIPNFLRFQAKSKQSEARELLSSLYTAETAYFAEFNAYNTMTIIGFTPAATPRYYSHFMTNAGNLTIAGVTSFTCDITAELDADATTDQWQVTDQSRNPVNIVNDVNS